LAIGKCEEKKREKEEGNENYKSQIPNHKQIPNPKLQITKSSLETEYR
jgi:hypothetical protein